MNGSLQYSALTRLLTLNNQVHDLENQLRAETVTALPDSGSRIAEMQDQIDRFARASLAACWLGNADAEDEEYGL